MMNMIREYTKQDIKDMVRIWNEIVEDGMAFPQEECLTEETGASFFASQSYTAVAEIDGNILGLYILHPNNVGRCGHICNASYAVSSNARGKHIGEQCHGLVRMFLGFQICGILTNRNLKRWKYGT